MEWTTHYITGDEEEFDFDYYDARKEQQAEWQAEMDEAMLWDI
jgi:hypothetical protein